MSDAEQVWLVERDYSDKGLVTLVYATPDGTRQVKMNRSSNMLRSTPVTAAIDADPDKLTPVQDEDDVDRYEHEATRMADSHDPDDEV